MSLSVLDLNGITLYFGTADKIPSEAEIVVDFRPTAETEAQLREEHIRHPCFDSYETSLPEKYKNLIESCLTNLQSKKIIYLLDNSGAGNSAMTAWILLTQFLHVGRETGLGEICKAYSSQQDIDQKWKNLGVPRYSRMKCFGEIFLRGCSRRNFLTRFFSRNRRKYGSETGAVLTSCLPHHLSNGPQSAPLLDGFENIEIINNVKCKWRCLHPDILGHYHFPITTVEKKTVYSANVTNLITAVSVYKSVIDESDELKSIFYEDREDIAKTWPNKERRHKIKIKHPRGKETREQKSHPTYPKTEPPVCYFWMDKFLLEVEFRRYWSQIYETLASKSDAYRQLQDLRKTGVSLFLMDYDGYNFHEDGMTLNELFEDPEKPWSFTHVLQGMLTENRVWMEDSKSSDSDIEST